jgi:hypothetical protein
LPLPLLSLLISQLYKFVILNEAKDLLFCSHYSNFAFALNRRFERAWLQPRRKAKQINAALAAAGMLATCSELP